MKNIFQKIKKFIFERKQFFRELLVLTLITFISCIAIATTNKCSKAKAETPTTIEYSRIDYLKSNLLRYYPTNSYTTITNNDIVISLYVSNTGLRYTVAIYNQNTSAVLSTGNTYNYMSQGSDIPVDVGRPYIANGIIRYYVSYDLKQTPNLSEFELSGKFVRYDLNIVGLSIPTTTGISNQTACFYTVRYLFVDNSNDNEMSKYYYIDFTFEISINTYLLSSLSQEKYFTGGWLQYYYNSKNQDFYQLGYVDGVNDGNSTATDEELATAEQRGYDNGYYVGIHESLEDISPTNVFVSFVNSFLNLRLFGSFTVGYLLGLIFGCVLIGLLFTLLR